MCQTADRFHALVFGPYRLNFKLSKKSKKIWFIVGLSFTDFFMILSRTVQNLKTFDLTWCKTEKRRKNSPENRYYHNLLEKLIIDLSNCWFKLSNEKFYNLFNVFCHRSWNICWFRSVGLISVTMMTHMNAAQSSKIGKKHFVYLSQILIILHL